MVTYTTRKRGPALIAGWLAVMLSTALSSLWAFWGSIESFHEGWYYPELKRNLALTLVHYLPWMFIPMVAGLLALWHRVIGIVVHTALAGCAISMFGWRGAGAVMLAFPIFGVGLLYVLGRPYPVKWARRLLIGVPILTAIVAGAYPGWRALTRPTTPDLSMRQIQGDGVNLTWAPSGPGWDTTGFSWFEAKRRCDNLTADGASLAESPQGHWRLPTVSDVVQTMQWRGENAGGRWNPDSRRATYRSMPDKEPPLWNPHSQVIYWWTADEIDPDHAYRVVYNGQVHATRKVWNAAYLATRCVKVDAVKQ